MHQASDYGDSYQRVEVIVDSCRRRLWNDAEKAPIVTENAAPEANVSEVVRRNGCVEGF
jgi:hypothetical protein